MKNHKFCNVCVYFRGCISDVDCRQLIYAAGISDKPDSSGKRLMSFNCSVDGEILVVYQEGSVDNFITNQIEKLLCVPSVIRQLHLCENERYRELVNPKEKLPIIMNCRRATSYASAWTADYKSVQLK